MLIYVSVRIAVRRQYEELVDRVAKRLADTQVPQEGWIRTVRKALGMSGPQLARRLGVTKAAIYQAERREQAGEVTIKYLETVAQGLGCRFVYAFVPELSVKETIRAQAHRKAMAIVGRANTHMALEQQAVSSARNRTEVERLVEEMLSEQPSDFWDDS